MNMLQQATVGFVAGQCDGVLPFSFVYGVVRVAMVKSFRGSRPSVIARGKSTGYYKIPSLRGL